ncbi:MAG: adenylyltransferase/cytidyltransferase family protein [Haloarculaceae archaeon]
MDRVVAQGTFDILHPGHVHYLRDAASMGEELHVIVARSENVTHKPSPIISGPQRVEMVEALKPVDHARLGHPDDIFVPIEEIEPSVIALGHDQHHDAAGIEAALAERGIDCEVVRSSGREPESDELLSTGRIIDKILDERA